MDSIDIKLTKEEANLLDSILTNELIRVEFPNGKQKTFTTEKEVHQYSILAELLRKAEDATTYFN